MAYFLTHEPHEPSRFYSTDASPELVKAWLDAHGDDLLVYFDKGHVDDEISTPEYVSSVSMWAEIECIETERTMRAAKRKAYLDSLTPEERYR